MYIVGDMRSHMRTVENGEEKRILPCLQWGNSDMSPVEKRICVRYPVGDSHSYMCPNGDRGGEEDLYHVCSGGCSVTHVPSGE